MGGARRLRQVKPARHTAPAPSPRLWDEPGAEVVAGPTPAALVATPTDRELLALVPLGRRGIEALIDAVHREAGLPALRRAERRAMAHRWGAAAREAWRAARAADAMDVAVAATVTLEEGERALRSLLESVARRHADYAGAVEAAGRPVTAPAPTLAAITTAVGKTQTAVEVLAGAGLLGLYLTISGERRDDVLAKLLDRGVLAAGWYGRSADAESPGYCPAMAIVARLGAANRMPGVLSCPTCPHGMATMRDRAVADGDSDAVARLDADAARLGHNDLPTYERCCYVTTAARAREADVIVADHRSYAPGLASRGGVPRLLVLDEEMAGLMGSMRPDLSAVGRWLQGTDPEIVARLDRRATELEAAAATLTASAGTAEERDAAADARSDARTMRRRVEALEAGRPHLQVLHSSLADMASRLPVGRTYPLPAKMASAIEALAAIEATVQDRAAAWEHARVDHPAGAVWAPVRGMDSLRWGMGRTVRVRLDEVRGAPVASLVWEAPSPLLTDIVARRVHAALLDATPAPALCAVVEAAGGSVTAIRVEQRLDVTRWRGAFRGRGRRTSAGNKEGVERAAAEMGAMRSRMAEVCRVNRDEVAVISHRIRVEAYAAQVGIDLEAHPELGWWARDDRGSNDMEGMPLLIDGWQMPPDHALADDWARDRALRILAGEDAPSIPYWPDSPGGIRDSAAWVAGVDIAIGPGQAERCPIALPADSAMRAWLIDRCTRDVVQAIGRTRAARADVPVPVWLVGGIPPELPRHGIELHAVRAIGDRGRVRGNALQSARAEDRIAQGLRALLSGGEAITYQAIGQAVYALTGIRPSDSTIAAIRRRYGADWGEVLAALEGRIEASGGRDPIDRAAGAWRALLAEGEPTTPVGRALLDLLGAVVDEAQREAGAGAPLGELVRAGP